jgi:hypothetical protein
MTSYILYSSNSRPRYVSDIINVLALPYDMEYQFRYKESYISTSFKHLYAENSNKLNGQKILISFKDEDVIIPIRFAQITKIEKVTDFYVIRFSVKNYVEHNFLGQFNLDIIKKRSLEYLNKVNTNEKKLALQEGFCDLVNPDKEINNFNNWINTAKNLSLTPTFSNSYFLNIELIRNNKKKGTLYNFKTHHFEISENNFYSFKITYYTKDFLENDIRLEVTHNSDSIKLTSSNSYNLNSRYDSVKVWLKSLEIEEDTFLELLISIKNTVVKVDVELPIFVKKSKNDIWFKVILSFIGASLISIPSFLGDEHQPLKIIFAAIGAFIIAISTNFTKKLF